MLYIYIEREIHPSTHPFIHLPIYLIFVCISIPLKMCSIIIFDLGFHFLAWCSSEVRMDTERASLNFSWLAWLGALETMVWLRFKEGHVVKCNCTMLPKSPAMNNSSGLVFKIARSQGSGLISLAVGNRTICWTLWGLCLPWERQWGSLLVPSYLQGFRVQGEFGCTWTFGHFLRLLFLMFSTAQKQFQKMFNLCWNLNNIFENQPNEVREKHFQEVWLHVFRLFFKSCIVSYLVATELSWVWISCSTHLRHLSILGDESLLPKLGKLNFSTWTHPDAHHTQKLLYLIYEYWW